MLVSALDQVSKERLEERVSALAKIGVDPSGGITRLGLTPDEEGARILVESWLTPLGYICERDGLGTMYCRSGSSPRTLIGSHLDTVRNGGKYDGALGVVAAAEVATAAHEAHLQLDLEVVAWADEEGARFGTPLLGSAAAFGLLPDDALQRADSNGTRVVDAATALFGRSPDPTRLLLDTASYRAYLELHIEQGPRLEMWDVPVGVVTAIVGLYHGRVQIVGEANHAGTTPVADRRDPVVAASECILAIDRSMRSTSGAVVATVGEIEARPGVKNVIAGSCSFSLDVRSPSDEARTVFVEELWDAVARICDDRGVTVRLEELSNVPAAEMSSDVMGAISRACEISGVSGRQLPSGAGHDAQNCARASLPTGMVFVRSQGGSHNPAEYANPADAAAGVRVLLATCVSLA